MTYTDGLLIRCPECGALNVVNAGTDMYCILKCLNCESSIMPHDSIMFKQGSNLVIP